MMNKLHYFALCSAVGFCAAGAAAAQTVADGINVLGATSVKFASGPETIAGNLYLPANYHASQKYPAIVVSHPWGGVKEQTAGLYAQRLAKEGFVTLAYDASHYGESTGAPRDYEDPAVRLRDIRSAVSFLENRPEVRTGEVGTLGICAGGGYTLHEAQFDPRVKATASVVAYDIGGAARHGIEGSEVSSEQFQNTLKAVADEWSRIEKGEKPKVFPLLSDKEDWTDKTDDFTKEAYSYYREKRGASPNASNKFHFATLGLFAGYYPLEHMEAISPRPVLIIAGEKAQTLRFSKEAYEKAKEPKELVVVPGASHFAMYDKEEFVAPTVAKLADFFRKNLIGK